MNYVMDELDKNIQFVLFSFGYHQQESGSDNFISTPYKYHNVVYIFTHVF